MCIFLKDSDFLLHNRSTFLKTRELEIETILLSHL